jgi:predicted membrane chloride channel (bestrophin family)
MNISNYSRYTYGLIIGICVEYLIRVELLIYPIIIIIFMVSIVVIDLVSEHRANTQYDRYYKARNKMMDKHHTPSKD